MTTSAKSQVLALTPGEPAGIGPDIAVMLAQHDRAFDVIAIADTRLLNDRAERLGLALTLHNVCDQPSSSTIARAAGHLSVHPIDLPQPCTIGQLDTRNAAYVIQTLNQAVDGCMSGEYGAMVTAPVHKGVINDAGVAFSGHTELIAERTASYPVMMLTAGSFRVALATTHLPLAKVAEAITKDTLLKVIRILHDDLKAKFAIANPRILVCGLNPHAGEGGHLGHEEIDIIEPVLNTLRAEGINLSGPLPADTLFTPKHLNNADAVLAMFHDQGLPVLKYAGFGESVNLTLGLPIIRTSVDHGTALDLAGSGQIDTGSMSAALSLAHELVQKTARQQS